MKFKRQFSFIQRREHELFVFLFFLSGFLFIGTIVQFFYDFLYYFLFFEVVSQNRPYLCIKIDIYQNKYIKK